jgi:histone acetyltransferase (RNA polymerase elongator complex component)
MAAETPSPLALRERIASSIEKIDARQKHREKQVAFYGGSFTAMERSNQILYLQEVQPFMSSGQIDSIRLSTRPDALDQKSLDFLTSFGVKTVEIGAQSMDDRVLFLSDRGHTAEDTASAVRRLMDYGFEVGVQLMIGLPGDNFKLFLHTLDRIIELRPHFVRIHPTLVLKGAPLESLWRAQRYFPLSLEEATQWLKVGLIKMERASIPVARLGLQPTEELRDHVLAGPYHPAFRHLVESAIAFDLVAQLLEPCSEKEEVLLLCHPRETSNLRGQRNENVRSLKERFGLVEIRVQASEQVEVGTFSLQTPRRKVLIRRRDLMYDGYGKPQWDGN